MFKHVIDAKHIEGYKIWIAFNDGNQGQIDLKDKIQAKNGIFEPLKEISYFKNFTIVNDTLSWHNGADLAPESLYEL